MFTFANKLGGVKKKCISKHNMKGANTDSKNATWEVMAKGGVE